MTNSEKYLKDEKYIFDIAKGIAEAICYDDMEHLKKITEKEIKNWFTSNTKPTLTEDERVILRNITYDSEYKYIYRSLGMLYLSETEKLTCVDRLPAMHHLFQFIKERRRILD